MEGVRYGPVRVRISGDQARGREYLPRAMQLLRRTQERQRLGKLNILGDQAPLDDDSYCYVVLAGGMANLHIIAGHGEMEQEVSMELASVPDFVSGVVKDGHIIDVAPTIERGAYRTLSQFRPTLACIQAYRPVRGKRNPYEFAEAFQQVERLAVEPADEFDMLRNSAMNGPTFSQYTRLKPTMYSGAMRQVVQALMGFGHQRNSGRRQISLYEHYTLDEAPRHSDNVSRDYASEVARHGLRIRYDWRFARTHGIASGADGRRWLVEVGVNGVLAMPLPLHPATTTPEFRDRLDEAGDLDALTYVDTFGGFPTGEPFPSNIEAWIRAGRIQRLLTREDMEPFYRHSPYSSVMGWAFNLRGDEAHNTAWRWEDDGFQRGVHYAMMFNIGGMQPAPPDAGGAALAQRLQSLRGSDQVADDFDAVLWKCRRLTRAQVISVTARGSTDLALFNAINALSLSPLAPASASLQRQSEGYLHHPGRIGNLIKFPEPSIGWLVSHDMRAEQWAQGSPVCDTMVHVFFAGDELKWVKYFRDPRQSPPQNWNDHEECMYIGTWTSHEESGNRAMANGLYSNDFDDRLETAPTTSERRTVGKDLGYYSVTVADDPVRPYLGHLSRSKRFSREITTTTVSGINVGTGIAVPFDDREAYYYAAFKRETRSVSVSRGFQSLADPWGCNTWRNFPGWTGNWAGDINNGRWLRLDPHPDGCGPVTARTVRVPGAIYGGRACSDLADNGPWCFTCDDADRMVYSIPPPPLPPFESETETTSGYEVWLVSSSRFGPTKTHEHTGEFQLWPLISPFMGDANLSWDQSIRETHNAFGEADSIRYDVNLNSGLEVKGHPNWSGMESGALTYIGVING